MNRREFVQAIGILSTISFTPSCLFKSEKVDVEQNILLIGKEWMASGRAKSIDEMREHLFEGGSIPKNWKEKILKLLNNEKEKNDVVLFKGWTFFQTELDLCGLMYSTQ